MKMLVLIVDTSIQIIERLAELISETKKILLIDKAVSYEVAKKLFIGTKHDIVLLDIDLPGKKGSLELVKEIKKARRETLVVILFTHADSYIQEQYKTHGVHLFYDKYYDFESICSVINSLPYENNT